MNNEELDELRVQTKGEFGGLGIEVTLENGVVKVISPIDDTPAAKAGIMAGDLITHLNDEPVLGMTLSEAVTLMRGKVGSKIMLKVLRNESETIEDGIRSFKSHAENINDVYSKKNMSLDLSKRWNEHVNLPFCTAHFLVSKQIIGKSRFDEEYKEIALLPLKEETEEIVKIDSNSLKQYCALANFTS